MKVKDLENIDDFQETEEYLRLLKAEKKMQEEAEQRRYAKIIYSGQRDHISGRPHKLPQSLWGYQSSWITLGPRRDAPPRR